MNKKQREEAKAKALVAFKKALDKAWKDCNEALAKIEEKAQREGEVEKE